ncbi:hypothetical protein K7432_001329 [Basidiobolus ranarum]|uniref:Homeobox domain-containing protein n=1 Tax=Basidiobolus ranarum TaxID=34480 RepID=A0ABR2W9V0_9FUNG
MFETFHQSPHGEFRTSFYNPFEVKTRKRTKKSQFKVLERTFYENPKPNSVLRKQLAQELGMTPRGVQVWFQNRRAKAKNQRSNEENPGRDIVTSESQIDDMGHASIHAPNQFSQNGVDYEPSTPNGVDASHSNANLEKTSQALDRTRDSVLFSAFDLNNACFTSRDNSKGLEAPHYANAHEGMLKKSRQKPNPEALKIASTPEQYEMMLHQHQARREQQKLLQQQRKKSLESQLYYHQQGYNQMGEADSRLQDFRSRANSLPGQKIDYNHYGPLSASDASEYSTDLFSPMSGIMTSSEATPLTPMTAASMPEHVHNYMNPYSPSISPGLRTPNEAGDSHRSGAHLVNSTRRNSCPPEFIAAFADMQYLGEEKSHLATIVEDETNTALQQDRNQDGADNGYHSQPRYVVGINHYQRSAAPSSSAVYFQPTPNSVISNDIEYERLKTRRQSEHLIEQHPQTHDSIPMNSTAPLLRGHSLDSVMWQNGRDLRRY